MGLKIWHKLFIVFLLIAVAVLGLTAGLMRWSLRQGYLDRLNETDHTNLIIMAERLVQAYDPVNGWERVADNPMAWWRFLSGNGGHKLLQTSNYVLPPQFGEREAPLLPPDILRAGSRIGLFDVNYRFMAGNPDALTNSQRMEPVVYEGATIGYLGITSLRGSAERMDLDFIERRNRAVLFIVAAVLALALLAALIIARRPSHVFREMAKNARRLADGHYDARIPVTTRDELGELAADFNALAEALSKNREARQRWFADISHEQRTPLMILRGELQAIEDGVRPFDEAVRLSLATELQRLDKLVNDLYQLASSDLGALSYRKSAVNIVELVKDVTDSFSVRLCERELRLETLLPTEAIWVLADADRLAQLFGNLLENSVRYTDANGLIQMSAAGEEYGVVVVIQDSAPGVPSEALPRLFERLYRADCSLRRESSGAGLGLAICQNITEAHGGSIVAGISSLGGLRVEFRLPVLSLI
jgi:two-component system, OmpR family, sensor histidine kinase BaeS